MNNSKVFLIVLLVAVLAACESTGDQRSTLTAEERGAATEGGSPARSFGAGGTTTSDMDALDDLQSLFSERVIYFDYDSNEVRPEYYAIVEAHAIFLSANQNVKVLLEGHADKRGSREYNLALGESRSQSVAQQMRLLGVINSQMRLVSYGEERCVDEDHTEEAHRQNRRVEITY